MPNLEHYLSEYRKMPGEAGDPASTALVIGDDVGSRMIAAWPRIPLPTWKPARGAVPADRRERWLWIWAGYVGGCVEPVFLDDLRKMALVPTYREAAARWPVLVASMLIFPDGSLSEDAAIVLRAYVAHRLPRLAPEKPEKPRTPPMPRNLVPYKGGKPS